MCLRSLIISGLLGLALLWQPLTASASEYQAQSPGVGVAPIRVVVSMRPLQLLIEDLAYGVLPIEVTSLMPSNATPHDFSLSPQRVQLLRSADWLLWLGAAAEPYLQAAVLQHGQRQVALLDLPGVNTRYFQDHHQGVHHHHEGHQHQDGDLDPHLWWNLDNLILLATAWAAELSEVRPELKPVLMARLSGWREGVLALRENYRLLSQKQSLYALSYHDAFGYLTDDLGLRVGEVVMRAPDIKPGARHVLQVRQRVAAERLRCLLMEPAAQPQWLSLVDPTQALRRIIIDPLGWDVVVDQQRIATMLQLAYHKLLSCTDATAADL